MILEVSLNFHPSQEHSAMENEDVDANSACPLLTLFNLDNNFLVLNYWLHFFPSGVIFSLSW